MERRILLFGSLVFCLIGCAKKEQAVANADDIPLPSPAQKEVAPKPHNVQVAEGEMRELLLTLHRVHFSFNASTLAPPARDALEEASEKLSKLPDVALFVDGHTDERGTTEYNLSLGDRRAQTVVNFLTNLGIEKERLTHVSFGEEKPMSPGKAEMAHAKNRRVDFRLMKGDIQFVLEESPLIDDKGGVISSAK